MTHRIAVATTDQLTIYQHFGRTSVFSIVDLDEKGYQFKETRKVTPPCQSGQHDVNAFDTVLELLSDCEAVVVGVIGMDAAEYLINRGMRIFEVPGTVENVLNAIIEKQMLESG